MGYIVKQTLIMATYGHRSSQRLRRDEPAVASSSRHPPPARRNVNAVASSSAADSQTDPAPSDDDDNQGSAWTPYKKLNVSDPVRKQAKDVGHAEIEKKAAELVRYALACEYQRGLIRKENVTKLLLEDKKLSRCFGPIFNAAQKILHRTLGLHMVEVRPKGADNAELVKQAQEVIRAASSSANGLRARTQPPEDDSTAADGGLGSNIWTLRSAMPSNHIRDLVSQDNELSDDYARSGLAAASSSSTQRGRPSAREAKAAIDWSLADHQDGEMGLLYIILALILVNGRTITEGKSRTMIYHPYLLLPYLYKLADMHTSLSLYPCVDVHLFQSRPLGQLRSSCTCDVFTSTRTPRFRRPCAARVRLPPRHRPALKVHRRRLGREQRKQPSKDSLPPCPSRTIWKGNARM